MKLRKCRELNAIDVEQLLKKKLELKIRSRDYRGVGQGFCLYHPHYIDAAGQQHPNRAALRPSSYGETQKRKKKRVQQQHGVSVIWPFIWNRFWIFLIWTPVKMSLGHSFPNLRMSQTKRHYSSPPATPSRPTRGQHPTLLTPGLEICRSRSQRKSRFMVLRNIPMTFQ